MNNLHIFSDGTTIVMATDEEDAIGILNNIPRYEIKDFVEQYPDNQQVQIMASYLQTNIPSGARKICDYATEFSIWESSATSWILANQRGFLGLEK